MGWQDDQLADDEAQYLDEAARMYGPQEANLRDLYFRIRRDAHRRGLVFTLTIDEFSDLIAQPCYWSGRKPALRHHRRGGPNEVEYERAAIIWNGLDRLNVELGYVTGNCVPASAEINWARGSKSPRSFLTWVREVELHRRGKPVPRVPSK